MSRLDRAIDKAIAEENARFLADPAAIAEAQAEGDLYRQRLEDEGILPRHWAQYRVTFLFEGAPVPGMAYEAGAEDPTSALLNVQQGLASGRFSPFPSAWLVRAVEIHQVGVAEGGIVRQNRMCPNCGERHLCSGEFDELPIPTENRLASHG